MDLGAHFDARIAEIEAAFDTTSHTSDPCQPEGTSYGRADPFDFLSGFPGPAEYRFLSRTGIDTDRLVAALERARGLGLDITQVLCSTGIISESDYFKCMAESLGITYAACPVEDDGPTLVVPTGKNLHRMARAVVSNKVAGSPLPVELNSTLYLAPDLHELPILEDLLSRNPKLKQRIRISPRTSNTECLINRGKLILLSRAKNALNSNWEALSAKTVITATQAAFIALAVQALIFWWIASDGVMQIALHLLLSSCFAGYMTLRLYACFHHTNRRNRIHESLETEEFRDTQLPIYSVLVALYQEANQVDDLVNGLLQLDWPRELLEIKLICEADDPKTIAACRACIQRVATTCVKLIIVPDAQPRTKPKALNFALPLCRGEFVVVYDAEDRPDKNQLKEAFYRFRQGPAHLACLQAPLVIHNHGESLWSALFATEYSAQFDGLLPALEALRLPFPLGGTSNHFKRLVLINIGAWDPYNVTEDADLGMRLARSGCRSGTLSSPTYEEAPIQFKVWLGQRTRWFKGWFQTWLVHMRHPVNLAIELGLRGCFAFHILITAVLVSLLIHPFLYYHVLVDGYLLASGHVTVWRATVLGIDAATLLLTYLSMAFLAVKTLPLRKMGVLKSKLWILPVYWLLLSLAAWCALWELCRRPHHWQKTPHRSFKPEDP